MFAMHEVFDLTEILPAVLCAQRRRKKCLRCAFLIGLNTRESRRAIYAADSAFSSSDGNWDFRNSSTARETFFSSDRMELNGTFSLSSCRPAFCIRSTTRSFLSTRVTRNNPGRPANLTISPTLGTLFRSRSDLTKTETTGGSNPDLGSLYKPLPATTNEICRNLLAGLNQVRVSH